MFPHLRDMWSSVATAGNPAWLYLHSPSASCFIPVLKQKGPSTVFTLLFPPAPERLRTNQMLWSLYSLHSHPSQTELRLPLHSGLTSPSSQSSTGRAVAWTPGNCDLLSWPLLIGRLERWNTNVFYKTASWEEAQIRQWLIKTAWLGFEGWCKLEAPIRTGHMVWNWAERWHLKKKNQWTREYWTVFRRRLQTWWARR